LDANARLLLMQKIGHQLTYREISLLHDIPIGTVCTKVARALVKIQAALQRSPTLVKEMRSFLR
jgi:DNA-directed RNA polymerase specialized sigma24 family protein